MSTFNTEVALIRVFPIYCASQRCIPPISPPRILYLCYFSLLAGHSDKRRLYNTIREPFCCPHMSSNVYNTVTMYMSSTRYRRTNNIQRNLRLIPLVGPLDVLGISTLGALQKTKGGNKYIFVIIGDFFELTNDIPTAETTSAWNSHVFMEHWVADFGLPSVILADIGPQFTSKVFAAR